MKYRTRIIVVDNDQYGGERVGDIAYHNHIMYRIVRVSKKRKTVELEVEVC